MKLFRFASLLFVFAFVLLAVAPAYAGPGTGTCVQTVKAFIDATLDSPFDTDSSHGDAISDGFFGNEPNLLNTNTNDDLGPNEVDPGSSAGFVVGSGSPGPHLIGGGFFTWGSLINGVVSDSCAH